MREAAKLTVFLGCLSNRTMFSLYQVSQLRVVWERQIGTDRLLVLHTRVYRLVILPVIRYTRILTRRPSERIQTSSF
jgi:hypothetical protein